MPSLKRSSSSPATGGLFHLFVVYIVWSSTYLAIRVAVGEGSGFPPFAMGAGRMFIASLILLGFAYLRKNRLKPSINELLVLAASGTLLWVGGNGLVIWAEQHANSGFAALMVASTPIWVAFLDAILSRKTPSPLLIGSLLFGFCGLGVLMAPSFLMGNTIELSSTIALLGAAFSWACGSVLQVRYPVNLSAPVMSGYQHLISSFGFLVLVFAFREPLPHPTGNAWIAWAYLILFGSVFAFTSFICTLRLLPIHIAMTYAYVNPVLALFLGWWLLDESITFWTLLGAGMVISGVIGIFRDRYHGKQSAEG